MWIDEKITRLLLYSEALEMSLDRKLKLQEDMYLFLLYMNKIPIPVTIAPDIKLMVIFSSSNNQLSIIAIDGVRKKNEEITLGS